MALNLISLNFLTKGVSHVLIYSGHSLPRMIIDMMIPCAFAISYGLVAARNKKAKNPECTYLRSRMDAL